MANAIKRVANYLGLMDDPEFDNPVSSKVAELAVSNDVRIKPRSTRAVSSVITSTAELAPQLDLLVLDRIIFFA